MKYEQDPAQDRDLWRSAQVAPKLVEEWLSDMQRLSTLRRPKAFWWRHNSYVATRLRFLVLVSGEFIAWIGHEWTCFFDFMLNESF